MMKMSMNLAKKFVHLTDHINSTDYSDPTLTQKVKSVQPSMTEAMDVQLRKDADKAWSEAVFAGGLPLSVLESKYFANAVALTQRIPIDKDRPYILPTAKRLGSGLLEKCVKSIDSQLDNTIFSQIRRSG